jgi:predicted TIM-barrel fold metal-dependent hydrolase
METVNIINCHVHTFNRNAVPERFLPKWLNPLANLLENKGAANLLCSVFNTLRNHELALLVKKYHAFLNVGDLKSQLEIFKYLQGFYPIGTRFCVLPMDMEFMEAGSVRQSYLAQLDELAAIKQDPAYRDLVHPFVFVHPERKGIFDIVKRYVEEKGFAGLKLYPPLGYYPFDERLNEIYAYAEKYQLPITTHCARGGVFYKGKITGDMLIHPKTGEHLKDQKNKFFTDAYTDPDNYRYVLEQFPNLKINLAHFGGYDEWQKYLDTAFGDNVTTWYEKIAALIRRYPNVYSDISYTMFSADLFNLLKLTLADQTLKSKILYGSDFYMVEQQTNERQFVTNIRACIGEENFKLIAEQNPTSFLYNSL